MTVNATTLINQLFDTAKTIGFEKTQEILQEAQSREVTFSNSIVENIVLRVAETTEVPVDEIIYGMARKNERKMAIGLCAIYLRKLYSEDVYDVAMELRKDRSLISRYGKMVERLNPKHKADGPYIEWKEILDNILLQCEPGKTTTNE